MTDEIKNDNPETPGEQQPSVNPSHGNQAIHAAKEAAAKAQEIAKQGISTAKKKFEEAGGVDGMKAKGKGFLGEIKAGFKPDEGASGFKGFSSRIKNLWKSGISGKITMAAAVLVAVMVIGNLGSHGDGGGIIKIVKNGFPPPYKDVTIEGGYKFALKSPQWDTITSERGQRVVEVSGEVKNDKLRAYILGTFYESEVELTGAEKTFWEKYPFIYSELLMSRREFIEKTETSQLTGFVKENLRYFNEPLAEVYNSYNNVLGFQKSGLSRLFSELDMDPSGELPDLVARLKSLEGPSGLKEDVVKNARYEGLNVKSGYRDYLERKAKIEAYEKQIKETDNIKTIQKQFERDHENARDARLKFLKSFWNKSDPIVSAQFIMNVDGKTFSSGAVIATLDGGPWDGKELSLDLSEWQSLVFSN